MWWLTPYPDLSTRHVKLPRMLARTEVDCTLGGEHLIAVELAEAKMIELFLQ